MPKLVIALLDDETDLSAIVLPRGTIANVTVLLSQSDMAGALPVAAFNQRYMEPVIERLRVEYHEQ